MEHGNAARLPGSRRADLTARRVRSRSIGMTEEAKARGNALDMPTSVRSEMARKLVEPPLNREMQMTTDARRLMRPGAVTSKEHGTERLPVSIAKWLGLDLSSVEPRVGQNKGRPYEGLSRMRGNSHVRF